MPVYIRRLEPSLCCGLSDLAEVEGPMIIRVNNDVILGLTTGHWSRQAWPQCDIIIDPTYPRFPYFQTGQIHINREKVPTFVYIIVNIPAPRPLNNNACGSYPLVRTRFS